MGKVMGEYRIKKDWVWKILGTLATVLILAAVTQIPSLFLKDAIAEEVKNRLVPHQAQDAKRFDSVEAQDRATLAAVQANKLEIAVLKEQTKIFKENNGLLIKILAEVQ